MTRRKIHQCARRLGGKMMLIQWIKQAAFNFVTTSPSLLVIYGTLLIEHFSYFGLQENSR
jgi:hypothetical protein